MGRIYPKPSINCISLLPIRLENTAFADRSDVRRGVFGVTAEPSLVL